MFAALADCLRGSMDKIALAVRAVASLFPSSDNHKVNVILDICAVAVLALVAEYSFKMTSLIKEPTYDQVTSSLPYIFLGACLVLLFTVYCVRTTFFRGPDPFIKRNARKAKPKGKKIDS
jgi:TRAP-type C4-dicarboxylate transport system permease small subunit